MTRKVEVVFKMDNLPSGCSEAFLHLIWESETLEDAVIKAKMFISFLSSSATYLSCDWYVE